MCILTGERFQQQFVAIWQIGSQVVARQGDGANGIVRRWSIVIWLRDATGYANDSGRSASIGSM
jgi:hypothetical protein